MIHICKQIYNLKFSRFPINIRQLTSLSINEAPLAETNEKNSITSELESKIIYNCILESKKVGFIKRKKLERVEEREKFLESQQKPLPIVLQYIINDLQLQPKVEETVQEAEPNVHFPFVNTSKIDTPPPEPIQNVVEDKADLINEEIRLRNVLQKDLKTWMTSYDNFDDTTIEDEDASWEINYGTPDPKIKVSNVPCGGCGAPLHCKDTSLPGYIPSEIFKNVGTRGGMNLQSIICQRCYFLKNYNLALQMRVTESDYPKVLQTVSQRRGLVVLLIDLLDFPCSIWPGIADIFGSRYPLVVVGNKVDLLPQDNRNYLEYIKKVLVDYVKLSGFASFAIKDVALVSAKTGHGIEDLITKLFSQYEMRGDVYLVGCTNVGKSSLFNALLQSDYCKIQAVDLIQRATTSVWPGTTINLLKFPIKRPVGYRQYLRHKRLQHWRYLLEEENKLRREQLRQTNDPKYATLVGKIEITENPFSKDNEEKKDVFGLHTGSNNASGIRKMGIDESIMEYAYGKWCFDTPGVVNPDQILNLLLTDELLLTLPKELIQPRSFCLKPNSSLFIAGLARLDYINGPDSIRFTVFASNQLPITICTMDNAAQVYQELLKSNLFKVPINSGERLEKWPGLQSVGKFNVNGTGGRKSCKDVVLSNAGWVALTGRAGIPYELQAWTPEKRGFYLRDCLLPNAVCLKGRRIDRSVAYGKHRFYVR